MSRTYKKVFTVFRLNGFTEERYQILKPAGTAISIPGVRL